MPAAYLHRMPSRHPPRHPFALVANQARTTLTPALILAWVRGRKGDPTGWYAEIVVGDTVELGHPVKMLVAAAALRPWPSAMSERGDLDRR